MNLLEKISKLLISAFSVAAGLIMIYFSGKNSGKKEAELRQKDDVLKKAELELTKNNLAAEKYALENVKFEEEITKNTEDTNKIIKDAGKRRSYDFNTKLAVVFLLLFSVSCGNRHPAVIYRQTLPALPEMRVFSIPEYRGEPVIFDNNSNCICLSEREISDLFSYTMGLKKIIGDYGSQSRYFNSLIEEYRKIYSAEGETK
jgi:hypothetical protein